MLKQVIRICPNCNNENQAGANFCLKCGTALDDSNDFVVVKNGDDLHFPIQGLDLDEQDKAAIAALTITKGPVPNGYQNQGIMYAEGTSRGNDYQAAWRQMVTNLFQTLISKDYRGVANVTVTPTLTNTPGGLQLTLFLSGDALVQQN